MATATIKMRRDTLTNWESKNPILSIGEIGVITTVNGNATDLRIGNGVDVFKNLPNFNPSIINTKVDSSRVLTDVPLNAKFTDTVYVKPLSEPISYITNLQSVLDSKVIKETGKALVDTIHYNGVTLDVTNLKADVAKIFTTLSSPDINLDDLNEVVTFIKQNRSLLESMSIAGVIGLQAALDSKVDDSQVLTNVPAGAVFTDTVYTHPLTHPMSMIEGLQTALDGKVTAMVGWGLISDLTLSTLNTQIDELFLLLDSTDPLLVDLQTVVTFVNDLKSSLDSLGIMNIAGLQAALDAKANVIVPEINTEFLYNIDCSASTHFSQVVTGDFTQTFTNLPTAGTPRTLTITLKNAGAHMIVWHPSIKWAGGLPTFSVSGTDSIEMYTIDGGVNWYAKATLNYV